MISPSILGTRTRSWLLMPPIPIVFILFLTHLLFVLPLSSFLAVSALVLVLVLLIVLVPEGWMMVSPILSLIVGAISISHNFAPIRIKFLRFKAPFVPFPLSLEL